jgi:hypothetical protein
VPRAGRPHLRDQEERARLQANVDACDELLAVLAERSTAEAFASTVRTCLPKAATGLSTRLAACP